MLLTDEEIEYEIKYVYEHNDFPIEVLLKPLIQSTNKAQLKKVVEWLKSGAEIATEEYEVGITVTREDWQSLLEEAQ